MPFVIGAWACTAGLVAVARSLDERSYGDPVIKCVCMKSRLHPLLVDDNIEVSQRLRDPDVGRSYVM